MHTVIYYVYRHIREHIIIMTKFAKLKHTPDFPVKLNVPFKQKDLAKAKGAMWNRKLDSWIAGDPAVLYKCHEWAHVDDRLRILWDKEWLDIPYRFKERAKELGARYHPLYHCWYAPMGHASLSVDLDRWRMRHLVGNWRKEC